jgi:hypothetical protein
MYLEMNSSHFFSINWCRKNHFLFEIGVEIKELFHTAAPTSQTSRRNTSGSLREKIQKFLSFFSIPQNIQVSQYFSKLRNAQNVLNYVKTFFCEINYQDKNGIRQKYGSRQMNK